MSEMGHCRGCRWWQGGSSLPPPQDGWRHCWKVGSVDRRLRMGPSLAMADDADDRPGHSWATLMTAPEFGCVQFEESPA